ncbi:type II toxin-antitoxin system RelE/ParE family toxin [Methylobacterium sp. J-088]|uniref:type II toxin-antitoxin system RelE/ParE family toxin n=1 Tax=Methylobacterium sp. J-088 TaxID=2836664 RepID=UPI001FB91D1F|nr:type II toxin-antitoxin system RelE/ParE family toxin [Methylobacterium sp. J-088]MCJ2064643.1 type II toxin-antitoxin system RelE/ParE family toxin [Methylobacterium sp. J-088]
MGDYALTARAEAEPFGIAVSGYRQFGIRQAETCAGGLEHVFQLLADNPRMGWKADAIRPGVHRHEHAAHVILYEPVEGGVLILEPCPIALQSCVALSLCFDARSCAEPASTSAESALAIVHGHSVSRLGL